MEQQKPYEFHSMGMLAYIGGFQALSQLPADIKLQGDSAPPRPHPIPLHRQIPGHVAAAGWHQASRPLTPPLLVCFRRAVVAAVAVGVPDAAGQLATAHAGAHRLDQDSALRPRHFPHRIVAKLLYGVCMLPAVWYQGIDYLLIYYVDINACTCIHVQVSIIFLLVVKLRHVTELLWRNL